MHEFQASTVDIARRRLSEALGQTRAQFEIVKV